MISKEIKIAFFGTSEFSVFVLEALKEKDFLPNIVITQPDKPKGRKMSITPPPVKTWAIENKIDFIQPEKLEESLAKDLQKRKINVCLLASYGKIIPSFLLNATIGKILNVHPSLLPKYRGASPIQTEILNDDSSAGVTIIRLDESMDHGPIVAQKAIEIKNWPIKTLELKKILGGAGGEILADILPKWLKGEILEKVQDEKLATFTRKFEKSDGLIDLKEDGKKNYLKFCALSESPGTFFFTEKAGKKIRVVIKEAILEDGKFIPTKVVPEGKKEMGYEDFLRGLKL